MRARPKKIPSRFCVQPVIRNIERDGWRTLKGRRLHSRCKTKSRFLHSTEDNESDNALPPDFEGRAKFLIWIQWIANLLRCSSYQIKIASNPQGRRFWNHGFRKLSLSQLRRYCFEKFFNLYNKLEHSLLELQSGWVTEKQSCTCKRLRFTIIEKSNFTFYYFATQRLFNRRKILSWIPTT